MSARRYAQAAFKIALEKGETEQWQKGLGKLVEAFQDRTLVALLESPRLALDAKSQLLAEKLGRVMPLLVNFGLLLATRRKTELARAVLQEYGCLLDEYGGIARADVITAIPLDRPVGEKVVGYLEEMSGKKVVATFRVDAGIIGGVVARVGDQLIDGSVRGQIAALRERLAPKHK